MPVTNTLTWVKSPDTDVAKYNVYRKIGSAPSRTAADKFASVPATANTYIDSVTTDGDFFYGVSAEDTAGLESPLSNIVDKVVNALPPQAPTSLVIQ